MGKKRSRVPGVPAGRSAADTTATTLHAQTLEDDVREQRDVQFAQEKRNAQRLKRRRVSDAPTARRNVSASDAGARKGNGSKWNDADDRNGGEHDGGNDGDDNAAPPLDRKTGAKILAQARQQRAEIRGEDGVAGMGVSGASGAGASVDAVLRSLGKPEGRRKSSWGGAKDADANSDEGDEGGDDDDDDDDDDGRSIADTLRDGQSTFGDDERDLDFLDGSKITEEEELALSLFSRGQVGGDDDGGDDDTAQQAGAPGFGLGQPQLLSDIILAKIREKEEADAEAAAMAADPERAAREKKIAEVYGLVGNIMSRYRSGKVPKAFKVIPKVENWENLLHLTRPDGWTPAAVYVATRLLASQLSGKKVVSFYEDILLPRCLEDISENKKLNYHLYRALRKAVYKPDAFCKGILFPVCEDKTCTLRQATVIGSVVTNVSIPMLHSAAALFHISKLTFKPTSCIVMTALVEKKYALPYKVVDAVVDHFLEMKNDTRTLPLMWHKCLLAFAQRYKIELTKEQKEQLKVLMRRHSHHLVTAEIRRELFSARNRGDNIDPDADTIAKLIANASVAD